MMTANEVRFTPTEQRIMDLLDDGNSHTRKEIHALLSDNLSAQSAIQFHISNIRKKVAVFGHEILISLSHKNIMYRLVRRIS